MMRFLSDDWARIPFSVIGMFLLIGSSITTVYISRLEVEKSEEIAVGLSGGEVEMVLRYAEADLARCLNYAASKAFEQIGKTPVVQISGSVFNIDADGDHVVTCRDVNLNWMRFIAAHAFNQMIAENFFGDRYTNGRYAINITNFPVTWQNITVHETVFMTMNRTLDHPFILAGRGTSRYPVYPILSVNITMIERDLTTNNIVLAQTPVISTVVTSRYLLLENLTDEFDARLDETFGSLGVSVLVGAMGLTWLRGYAQFGLNKPVNIISTDWLTLLTNGGILMEEGFVFNSVDPLGVIYFGYETAKAVAKEFAKTISEDQELENQTSSPISSTDELKDRFKYDTQRIGNQSVDVETNFSLQVNISSVCEYECRKLISDEDDNHSLSALQTEIYSATAELYTDRTLMSDNWASIQLQYQQQKDASKITERSETQDDAWAEAKILFPLAEGWTIDAVTWQSGTVQDESSNFSSSYIKSRSLISNIPFNNTNLTRVILGGENWNCERNTNYSYSWLLRTQWMITAHHWNNQTNSTETQTTLVSFMSSPYFFSPINVIIDTLRFEYVSRVYAAAFDSQNDLQNAFQAAIFEGKDDPNLAFVYNSGYPGGQKTVLEYYQTALGFSDIFRRMILLSYDTDYGEPSYSDNKNIPECSDEDSRMSSVWLQNETYRALEEWCETISASVQSQKQVNCSTMPDEMLRQVANETLQLFQSSRAAWTHALSSQYQTEVLYKSAAAKVLYGSINTYLNRTENRLSDIKDQSQQVVEQITNKAMDDSGVSDSSYRDIKQVTLQAQSLHVALPVGAIVTLEHNGPGFEHWTEPASFALLQKPSFFSNQSFTEYQAMTGESYHLKYRNVNIFSPGAGLTDYISQGFDALNKQVLTGIDQGFARLHDVSNLTIRAKLAEALDDIASLLTNEISSHLAVAVGNAQGSGSYLTQMDVMTPEEVESIVNQVVDEYSGNPQEFIHQLNTSVLLDKIIARLQAEVECQVRALYGAIQEMIIAAKEAVKSQVLSVYDAVVSEAISRTRKLLKEEYNDLSEMLEKQVGDAVSSLVGSLIPSGLPLLPPFGWWCTLNVWYIEVQGEIPYFEVVDTQDETLAHPFWGHTAEAYTRTNLDIYIDFNNDSVIDPGELIGKNIPIGFKYNTGTFIVVPPGKTGVGDRSGGWDELDETGTP